MVAEPRGVVEEAEELAAQVQAEQADAIPVEPKVLRTAKKDRRPVQDVPADSVDPAEVIGAEVLETTAENVTGHSITIRGTPYPLPRFGPAILVILPKRQKAFNRAVQQRELLIKRGYKNDKAEEQSGAWEAFANLLQFVCSILEGFVPEELLVQLSWEEMQEVMAQMRPFGEDETA